jgi:hypothetical protein
MLEAIGRSELSPHPDQVPQIMEYLERAVSGELEKEILAQDTERRAFLEAAQKRLDETDSNLKVREAEKQLIRETLKVAINSVVDLEQLLNQSDVSRSRDQLKAVEAKKIYWKSWWLSINKLNSVLIHLSLA